MAAYRRRGSGKGRLVIAVIAALIALAGYFLGTREVENPVTGETQRVSLSPDQEIQLGLQAAPEVVRQHGGLLPAQEDQDLVDRVGRRLVASSAAGDSGYRFDFHLLADEQTVNAFALPGGQIFLTAALARQLRSEAEVAGVLAHEIGHVVGRHGAERIAKSQLIQGLTGAAVIAAYDPSTATGDQRAQMAALVGQLVQMRYSRDDELESDRLGVRFLADAGYDPRALIGVMEVLAASGGGAPTEFFSTHPNPDRRMGRIDEAIAERFPDGVPEGLER